MVRIDERHAAVREAEELPPSEVRPRTFGQKLTESLYSAPVLGGLALAVAGVGVAGYFYFTRGNYNPPREPPRIEQNGNPVVIPPVSLETLTPTATRTPTPTPVDPIVEIINSNPELSYKLTDRTRQSMIKELKESPYNSQLLPLISQLSEVWNYKVRREDEVLCVIIPQYTPDFNCNSAEAWQFRWDNGSYHLNSWLKYSEMGDIETIHILPLDNHEMREYLPNKEDREFVYMNGLWVPNAMMRLDLSDMKNDAERTGRQRDARQWTTLRNNMNVILGVKKVNGLPYKNLRERIMRVYRDHNWKSYTVPDSDYANAVWAWGAQLGFPLIVINIPKENDYVGREFRKKFIPILEKWEDFRLIQLSYGLSVIDGDVGGLPEQFDTATTSIYNKAVGGVGFNLGGRYPEVDGVSIGMHQALGIPVPYEVLTMLPYEKLVFKGQVIGLYSAINGVRLTKLPYITGPTGETVWKLQE